MTKTTKAAAKIAAYYADPYRAARNDAAKDQMVGYLRLFTTKTADWGGINNDDLVNTLAQALVEVGLEQGLGVAMLEAFSQQLNEHVRDLHALIKE